MTGSAAALVVVFVLAAAPAAAQGVTQIVRDGSVGPDASFQPIEVGGVYEIGEGLGERPGGGSNLFHSFEFFDIRFGDTALFTANPALTTDNVISRVTGGSQSDIYGTISSDIVGADVWLLNPYGVMFGSGAELDVPAGFRVSTADVLVFDDLEWPTGLPRTGLLSAQPPAAYGFTSPEPKPITFDHVFNLEAERGETFSAVGGDITVIGPFDDGSTGLAMSAEGALVEFASVAGPGAVPVDVASLDVFDPQAPANLGTVGTVNGAQLKVGRIVIRSGRFEALGNAQINAEAAGGGSAAQPAVDIQVAGDAEIDGSEIRTDAFGSGIDGGVRIDAENIAVHNEGRIATFGTGAGRGGPVELIAMNGGSVAITNSSTVSTKTTGSHVGGKIIVRAGNLLVEERSNVITLTEGKTSMPAGGIDVEADTMSVRSDSVIATAPIEVGPRIRDSAYAGGGDIRFAVRDAIFEGGGLASAGTDGAGGGGGIRVEQAESLLATGVGMVVDPGTPPQASGLFARVGEKATGPGGEIYIDSRYVGVENGGAIDASTFSTKVGSGPAGNITIVNAETVEVTGGDNGTSQIGTRGDLGPGGSISIHTNALKLRSGGILTSSTSGPENAGGVAIVAKTVEISGNAGADPSAIISLTRGGPGAAGSIDIDASESVTITDGAVITVESGDVNSGPSGIIDIDTRRLTVKNSMDAIQANSLSGDFDAGNVKISAKKVELENSSISTSSEFTSGGNIEIDAENYIDLFRSAVSASVGGTGPTTGGDVVLKSDNVVVDHSSVSASAPAGSGGNILVDAEGFFVSGGDVQEVSPGVFVSDGSRFDVSGLLVGGTLQVTSPGTEIIGDLASLSSDFLDVSELLTEQCALREAPAGSLIMGGRDRAPASPGDELRILYLGDG